MDFYENKMGRHVVIVKYFSFLPNSVFDFFFFRKFSYFCIHLEMGELFVILVISGTHQQEPATVNKY